MAYHLMVGLRWTGWVYLVAPDGPGAVFSQLLWWIEAAQPQCSVFSEQYRSSAWSLWKDRYLLAPDRWHAVEPYGRYGLFVPGEPQWALPVALDRCWVDRYGRYNRSAAHLPVVC